MEVVSTPEISVTFYETTGRNASEDIQLNIQPRENLKSHRAYNRTLVYCSLSAALDRWADQNVCRPFRPYPVSRRISEQFFKTDIHRFRPYSYRLTFHDQFRISFNV
jgi:hypothetical protein